MPSPAPSPRKTRRRRRVVVVGCLLAAGLGIHSWRQWRHPPLRVSPETTVITSPLLPDGRPDYAAALNEFYSRGVTPENNLAVVVAQLASPELFGDRGKARDKFFRLLECPIPDGTHSLTSWYELTEQRGIALSDAERVHAYNPLHFDPQQHPAHAKYLEFNEPALDYVVANLDRTHFYVPLLSEDDDPENYGTLYLSNECSAITELLHLRSRQRLLNGDTRGAIDDAVTLIDFSKRIAVGFFGGHTGARYQQQGAALLASILMNGDFSREEIGRVRAALTSLHFSEKFAEKWDLAVQLWMLDNLAAYRTNPRAPWFRPRYQAPLRLKGGVDINRVLVETNRRFDRVREFLRIESWADRRQALIEFDAGIVRVNTPVVDEWRDEIYWRIGLEAPILLDEEYLLGQFPNVLYFLADLERTEVRWTLIDVGLALEEFRAEFGDYPHALRELVPEFLSQMPIDPWSQQPMRYELHNRGFVLFSDGPNEKSDGGWERYESPDADDIRFGLRLDEVLPAD